MRRWLLPAGVYVAITIALTYPLLRHIRSVFPHDSGGPALSSWILWWSTERLPFTAAWWNAPMFYPMAGAMALSQVLIGLLPIFATVQWMTGSPLVAYNVVFALSFPLSALAAFALAYELTWRRDAAFLAGLAFAFAPYRMGQLTHVQVLSYYWAPIALVGLHRYLRERDRRWLVLFAVAWLMQALSNGDAIVHLSLLVALWIVWFARPPRTAAPIVVAWAVAAIPLAPLLLMYRQVHTSLHLVGDINDIKRFGVDIADVLSAPPEVALWGSRLLPSRPETAVFPGATILIIGLLWLVSTRNRSGRPREPRTFDERLLIVCSAVAGLVALSTVIAGPWSIGPLAVTDFHKPFALAVLFRVLALLRGPWVRRAWREHSVVVFYVWAMAALYVLALGPEPRLLGRPIFYESPYAWLMRVPGIDVLRVPARFAMLAVLCQSLLLAVAIARWSSSISRRPIVVALIGAGLIVDGWARLPVEPAPNPGLAWQNVSAVIELPPGGAGDFAAIYRALSHGRPIVNGYGDSYPPHYLPLLYAIRDHQYSALQEVALGGPLGVAVNRAASDAGIAERMLGGMVGVTEIPGQEGWATFILRPHASGAVQFGREIPVRNVWANRHNEDIGRLADGSVETAWSSGVNQIGDEEVVIDLGSAQPIGAIVFGMGAFSFGFPRGLEIDASSDGITWASEWGGATAVLTVHAAIAEPAKVPMTIDLGQVSARFVRFRQIGTEPGIPWWIAELNVFAPAGATSLR